MKYLTATTLVACILTGVQGFTLPDEAAAALTFYDEMSKVGPTWANALSSWHCPTPAASSNVTCDPCGMDSWWGNFVHLGCRGGTTEDDATIPGVGIVTNLHVTDLHITGPVPQQACVFKNLRELDLDGGNMTGTIPEFLTTCFPYLNELDLSYNQLTGTVPAFISAITTMTELELESNQLTGTIPPELGSMPNLTSIRFENNKMVGTIPSSFSDLSDTLFILFLYNNDFEGDLSVVSGANLGVVSTSYNPKLCGMVPASVRWAHGYNPLNTSLGMPCM
ncbi:hypothetical protein ABBQ38_007769 [Trebouxia sp. C0009 RCD-2024]